LGIEIYRLEEWHSKALQSRAGFRLVLFDIINNNFLATNPVSIFPTHTIMLSCSGTFAKNELSNFEMLSKKLFRCI